jgi:hypothetical protein
MDDIQRDKLVDFLFGEIYRLEDGLNAALLMQVGSEEHKKHLREYERKTKEAAEVRRKILLECFRNNDHS